MELGRSGDSPAAPKFNIVSKPNDWSRSVAQAARAIDESELTETRVLQRSYWEAFHKVLDEESGPISGNRKAQPQSWMAYGIGRSGFSISAVMLRPKRQVRAELYIRGKDAKAFFGLLEYQRDEIEQELGYPLIWELLPSRQDCRICIYLDDANPENQSDWGRQHQWLATHLNDMHRVLAPRIRVLDADDWRPDGDD